MKTTRGWAVGSWISLPLVMAGGSLLLRLSVGEPIPFRATWLRAGHAHGGALLMLSLLYYVFLEQTSLSVWAKRAACGALFAGIVAQTGGFFIHAIVGQPGQPSVGTAITLGGAVLLASAIVALVYGLIRTR